MLEEDNSELTSTAVTKKINLLDAMHMLSDAWRKVNKSVIVNCWRKAGFKDAEEDNEGTCT